MKRVEPFLKLSPPVLDYQAPTPPKGLLGELNDLIDVAADLVGGRGWLLLIATIACIGIGVSIPGRIGASLVMIGCVLVRSLLLYWSKSSRW